MDHSKRYLFSKHIDRFLIFLFSFIAAIHLVSLNLVLFLIDEKENWILAVIIHCGVATFVCTVLSLFFAFFGIKCRASLSYYRRMLEFYKQRNAMLFSESILTESFDKKQVGRNIKKIIKLQKKIAQYDY
ncbi:hypothetical protein MHBO_004557 [Bonamia ostreae]|uniref:Uncharacterized protein n=1 Tax=Bonamia ostreae TaxID=126728 RepID=A0ABV2ATM1_9EUKA